MTTETVRRHLNSSAEAIAEAHRELAEAMLAMHDLPESEQDEDRRKRAAKRLGELGDLTRMAMSAVGRGWDGEKWTPFRG